METFILRFYNPAGENRQAFRGELEAAVHTALGGDLAGYAPRYREPWFEPALISEETPIVRHLAAGVSQATGRPARISTVSKQDSFLLTNHAGIPTVSFGVGRVLWPGGHHAPDEAIRLEEAWQGCLAARAAVRRWLEEAP